MQKQNNLSLVLGLVCLFWLNSRHGAYGFNPFGGYPQLGAPAAAAGAYQQNQQSAESESYKKAKSSSQSSAGAGQYGTYPAFGYPAPSAGAYNPAASAGVYNPAASAGVYNPSSQSSASAGQYGAHPAFGSAPYAGAYGYRHPAVGYPAAQVAAYSQQQKSAENEEYSKSKSASSSSAAAGQYGGYPANSFPPPPPAAYPAGYPQGPISSASQSGVGDNGPYAMSQEIKIGGAVENSNIQLEANGKNDDTSIIIKGNVSGSSIKTTAR